MKLSVIVTVYNREKYLALMPGQYSVPGFG